MPNHASMMYHVTAEIQDESHALIETRGHRLTLNVKKGAGEAGFNAAETLLAALGACMLTNVNAIGEKMHLKVDSARIEFEATRRDEPPALTEIRYKLILKSPEPPKNCRNSPTCASSGARSRIRSSTDSSRRELW
jgi:uncharacterized OsmC-like protein